MKGIVNMAVKRVRMYDPSEEKEIIVFTDIPYVVENPIGFNMIDVGIMLLNEKRVSQGLKPIAPETVAGSLQDLEKTGRI